MRPWILTTRWEGANVRGRVGLAILLMAASGCVPHTLLEQAIRARGGPLPALVRASETQVWLGFPGTWRWRTVVAAAERYAWSIETTGEPTHYLFDGRVARSFVGGALTAEDASAVAPLRSQARFMAVMQLDGLRAPNVRVRELSPAGRPSGATYGLEATYTDSGDRYLIGLDAQRLVRSVEGPVSLPPFGRPLMRVVLDDQRRVGGYRLAYRATWTADGAPLADERTLAACALDHELPATAFVVPATLPTCP
jgi:hypothetical protein